MRRTDCLSHYSPSLHHFSSNESDRDCGLKRKMNIMRVAYITNLMYFKSYERFLWGEIPKWSYYWLNSRSTVMVTIHFRCMKKSWLVILLRYYLCIPREKESQVWNNMRLSKLWHFSWVITVIICLFQWGRFKGGGLKYFTSAFLYVSLFF